MKFVSPRAAEKQTGDGEGNADRIRQQRDDAETGEETIDVLAALAVDANGVVPAQERTRVEPARVVQLEHRLGGSRVRQGEEPSRVARAPAFQVLVRVVFGARSVRERRVVPPARRLRAVVHERADTYDGGGDGDAHHEGAVEVDAVVGAPGRQRRQVQVGQVQRVQNAVDAARKRHVVLLQEPEALRDEHQAGKQSHRAVLASLVFVFVFGKRGRGRGRHAFLRRSRFFRSAFGAFEAVLRLEAVSVARVFFFLFGVGGVPGRLAEDVPQERRERDDPEDGQRVGGFAVARHARASPLPEPGRAHRAHGTLVAFGARGVSRGGSGETRVFHGAREDVCRLLRASPPPRLGEELVAAAAVPAQGTRDARDAVEVERAVLALDAVLGDGRAGDAVRAQHHRLAPARARRDAHRKRHRCDGDFGRGFGGFGLFRDDVFDDVFRRRLERVIRRARDPRVVRAPEPSPRDDAVEDDEAPFRGGLQRAAELERVGDGDVRRVFFVRGGNRDGLDAAGDAVLGRGDASVEVHQRRREGGRGGGAGKLRGERDAAREAHRKSLRGDARHLAGKKRRGGARAGGRRGRGLGAKTVASAQVARLARELGFGGRGSSPVGGLAGDRARVAHGEPLERAVRERRGHVHAPAAPAGGVSVHVGVGDGEGDVARASFFRDVIEKVSEEEGRARRHERRRRRLDDDSHRASVQRSVLGERDVRPENGECQALVRHAAASSGARDVSLEARLRSEREERRGDGDAHASAGVGGFVLRERASRAQSDRPCGGEHAATLAARHGRVRRRDVGVERRGRRRGDARARRATRVAGAFAGPDAPHGFVRFDVRVLHVHDGGARDHARVPGGVHLIARRDEDRASVRCRVVAERTVLSAQSGGRRDGVRVVGVLGVLGVRVDVGLERHGASPEHAGAAPLLVHLDDVPGENHGLRIGALEGALDIDHAAAGGEHAAAARRGDVVLDGGVAAEGETRARARARRAASPPSLGAVGPQRGAFAKLRGAPGEDGDPSSAVYIPRDVVFHDDVFSSERNARARVYVRSAARDGSRVALEARAGC